MTQIDDALLKRLIDSQLTLAEELTVTRARLAKLEALLVENGITEAGAVDARDDQADAELEWARDFSARLLGGQEDD